MTDKQNLIIMLANADAEFRVEHGDIYVPYGDTDTVAIFEFDKEGRLVMTYSRKWDGE